MVEDGAPEDHGCCLAFVRFLVIFASVLHEDVLDELAFRDEEFIVLRRSVEYQNNFLKIMVERRRIAN